ncbi:TetR/AcrR family transcriptional regulator [Maribacter sp. HTCC2170]|uniref:TetR/AcrR family transcriptional regulator n=1 Tax=Maribacter sp. (strain HTCC2170 / KCCM 42371) TaxID=313603 RepID=UPI00006BD232|nr:TetR/AcrR family transcriptional regulator [Maribacter sp. HTCC2170]EAR02570.1 hypothetical protein FB2170_04765 [Maribacter sp. HTCC2170]
MREKILDKANDLFLKLGFKSVTMDEIANEMAISKKTIYKYFNNKEQLIEACVINMQDAIDKMISDVSTQGRNAIEENFAIKNVFNDMFKKAETSPMYQLKKYYPAIYAKLMQREALTFSQCIMTNIEKGIEEKIYRENIDKEIVTKMYFTLLFGAYENEMFSNKMQDIFYTEMKILEYHTRAISTLYGISILERELVKNNQKNQ